MRQLNKLGATRHQPGRVVFAWHPQGSFLATAGRNGLVHITDRHGKHVEEVLLPASHGVSLMEWDREGEVLAVLQEDAQSLVLWELATRRLTQLETNLKDLSFIKWSSAGPQLAVGNAKGNLLIYNSMTRKKIPIMGKHPRRICAGAWTTAANNLVLGSEDKTLTVSNENGDTLVHREVRYAPLEICVGLSSHSSADGGARSSGEEATIAANLGGRVLMLCSLDPSVEPLELSFDQQYGELIKHCWLSNGLVALGFASGQLVILSTNMNDVREELYSSRVHPRGLTALAYNAKLRQIATAGPDGVRITETTTFRELPNEFIPVSHLEGGTISSIGWSSDGQILTIATGMGNVYNFVAKMPLINARYKHACAYLSSLREVTVVDWARRTKQITVPLRIEPAFIAMGGFHIAAGMNNKVYYHRISTDRHDLLVNDQEYLGAVTDVVLNDQFAAVLADGKIIVHPIELSRSHLGPQQNKVLPERTDGAYSEALCIAITDQFLYYGTRAGTIEVYYLTDQVLLVSVEKRLSSPARQIFPNIVDRKVAALGSSVSGTKLVVVDDNAECWLVNPASADHSSAVAVPQPPVSIKTVLWDLKEQATFSIFDGEGLHTYTYAPATIHGPVVSKVGRIHISEDGAVLMDPEVVQLPSKLVPLVAIGGEITCQTAAGGLTTVRHPLFGSRYDEAKTSTEMRLQESFEQHLALLNIDKAWKVALQLDKQEYWLALSNKAMELLNVEYALKVYRHLGDAGMVLALEKLAHVEDRKLLAGHMAMLFGDYQLAQKLFLESSYPKAALEMRQDLLHWEQALQLASTLAPERVPELSVSYAQYLESRGQVRAALDMYSQGEQLSRHGDKHLSSAWAGLARCLVRLGDLHEGLRYADKVNSLALYRECGAILEAANSNADAAAMFLKAEEYETAAGIYIRTQNFAQAAPFMQHVHSARLNKLYAQACERSGDYEEALAAYERAHDTNEIIRLYLQTLNQQEKAFELVRQTRDEEAAAIVAAHCKKTQNFEAAIEFLLLAKHSEEAFEIARVYNLVDLFHDLAGDSISNEDALKVAAYYEKQQAFGKAGRLYSACGHYQKALNLFLQCGDKEIDTAIEMIGKARSDDLAFQLIDFLMGERDGVMKDPNYVYKLYMALGNYKDAAKTALIIAKQDHESGNYQQAHAVLVDSIRQLESHGIHVPLQLRQSFELLHSYTLIKKCIERGDHMGAARMSIRVIKNISKFPKHYVNILTVAVIECARAGLQASASEYAAMLMPPQYRQQIPEQYRRQIEARVRRRAQATENVPEELSECPVSLQMIPETELECPTTKDMIPMCIISGRHIVRDDTCFCPNSGLPARHSHYVQYIEFEESKGRTALDPILGKPITVDLLRKATVDEVLEYIRKCNTVDDDKKQQQRQDDSTRRRNVAAI